MHKEHAWEGSNRGIRMLESTSKAPIWEEGCSHPLGKPQSGEKDAHIHVFLQRWLITLGKGQLLKGISPIRAPLVILPFNLKQSVCYYPIAFYLKIHLLSFPPPWNKNDEIKTLSLLFVSFFPWYSSTKHDSGRNAQLVNFNGQTRRYTNACHFMQNGAIVHGRTETSDLLFNM